MLLATLAATPVLANEGNEVFLPSCETSVSITRAESINPFYDLVEGNVIDEDLANKMTAFIDEWNLNIEKEIAEAKDDIIIQSFDLFGDMVESGLISQDKADEIKSYRAEQQERNWTENMNESLDRYVNEGIIKEAAANAAREVLLEEHEASSDEIMEPIVMTFSFTSQPAFLIHMPEATEGMNIESGVVTEYAIAEKSGAADTIADTEYFDSSIMHSETIHTGFSRYMEPLVEKGIISEDELKLMQESDGKLVQLANVIHFIKE